MKYLVTGFPFPLRSFWFRLNTMAQTVEYNTTRDTGRRRHSLENQITCSHISLIKMFPKVIWISNVWLLCPVFLMLFPSLRFFWLTRLLVTISCGTWLVTRRDIFQRRKKEITGINHYEKNHEWYHWKFIFTVTHLTKLCLKITSASVIEKYIG